MEKRCTKCGKSQPLNTENFYRDATRPCGFFPWCRACHKADAVERGKDPILKEAARKRAEEWYKNNRPKAADTFYLKHYRLSLSQVRKMKKKQKHLCAICGKFKRLCIDHDHKTGKIRGLLCRGCNGFLGLLENNPGIIKIFEDYIERYKS